MTSEKLLVKACVDEVLTPSGVYSQAIIDIADDIEEVLINPEATREDIGAAAYTVSVIAEICREGADRDWLLKTKAALDSWNSAHEAVNVILGLPPES